MEEKISLTREEMRTILKALENVQDSTSVRSIRRKLNHVLAEPTNTLFEYLYRDASNYKTYNSVVLKGIMTEEDFTRIKSCCDSNEYFIPTQVGLYANRDWDYDPSQDHPWFEITGFSSTKNKSPLMTVSELVSAFELCKGKWNSSLYF